MKACIDSLPDTAIILQKQPQTTPLRKDVGKADVLVVCRRPGRPSEGLISAARHVFPCALGRSGISAFKREGDGATPLATLHPVKAYFRRDRRRGSAARTRLPLLAVRPDEGWCDAPEDANYNRLVRLPFPASHEKMLREDRLYDVCVVLDWNVSPRKRGCGSAIFLHIARPGMAPTEGCIAVSPRVMERLLPLFSPRTRIVIGG